MHPESSESQPRVGPLRVGPETLDCNLVLAPMAGVTSLPFRLIAREAGAGLVFTETVSARGLAQRGPKSWRLVESAPKEHPLAYQLFGSDPAILAEATRMLVDRGARFVDLNCGCPVKKFIQNGAGSALLREPPGVGRILDAMRRALPGGVLSVKLRLGWDSASINAPEVARVAQEAGVDFLSVHGRTRAQQYSGRADRARISDVVAAVRVPVFANGDVTEPEHALEMLAETGAAGVMIGRGALSNPWIFGEIAALASGRPAAPPTRAQRARLVERHLALMLEYSGDDRSCVHMLKKYLSAWSTGLPGAGDFRDRVNRCHELALVLDDARAFFGVAA
jgi:nifR3 family TIM-barrel protein